MLLMAAFFVVPPLIGVALHSPSTVWWSEAALGIAIAFGGGLIVYGGLKKPKTNSTAPT